MSWRNVLERVWFSPTSSPRLTAEALIVQASRHYGNKKNSSTKRDQPGETSHQLARPCLFLRCRHASRKPNRVLSAFSLPVPVPPFRLRLWQLFFLVIVTTGGSVQARCINQTPLAWRILDARPPPCGIAIQHVLSGRISTARPG